MGKCVGRNTKIERNLGYFANSGGRGGIRTHGTLAGTPVFKTGALNHSATLPSAQRQSLSRVKIKDRLAGFWATGAPSSSQFDQPDQRAQDTSGGSGLRQAVSSTPGQKTHSRGLPPRLQRVNLDLMMVRQSLRVRGVPRWPTEPMIPTS